MKITFFCLSFPSSIDMLTIIQLPVHADSSLQRIRMGGLTFASITIVYLLIYTMCSSILTLFILGKLVWYRFRLGKDKCWVRGRPRSLSHRSTCVGCCGKRQGGYKIVEIP